jgi:hypothetical protein
VSRIPDLVRALVNEALAEQEQIGLHLAMWGYLSQDWSIAISSNPRLKKDYESRGMFSTEMIPSPMAKPWHHFHNKNQARKSQKLCLCLKP